MPRNKGWFRLYDRMIDSPEILELDDTEFRLIVSLWSLASASDADGALEGFRPRSLQRRLMPHVELDRVEAMLAHLTELGLITGTPGRYEIVDWERHQYEYQSKFPANRRKGNENTAPADGNAPGSNGKASGSDGEAMGKTSGSDGEGIGKRRGNDGNTDSDPDPDPDPDPETALLSARVQDAKPSGPIPEDPILGLGARRDPLAPVGITPELRAAMHRPEFHQASEWLRGQLGHELSREEPKALVDQLTLVAWDVGIYKHIMRPLLSDRAEKQSAVHVQYFTAAVADAVRPAPTASGHARDSPAIKSREYVQDPSHEDYLVAMMAARGGTPHG